MAIQNGDGTATDHDGTWTWDDRGRMTAMSIDDDSSSYTFDNMSNLTGMTGTNGITEQAAYNWAGQRLTLNGETRTYNNLMQLTRIQNGALDDEYIYQAGQNNGRIAKLIDHIRGETIDYTYDTLNRLTMAEQEAGQWGNAFAYDGWGNMTGETFTPGQAATPTPNFQPGRDPNGNITTNYGVAFDVENRLASTGTTNPTTYGYDPWGKRVRICCNTDRYNNQQTTYMFYGIDGKRLMTYSVDYNAFPHSNPDVYFGGTKVIAAGSGVSVDRLGSVRNNINGSIAYYPYGQERTSTPDGLDKFGTYTRDGSLGGFLQDYADQRYYAANVGAFWSADPGNAGTLRDPSSLNRYVYGSDDPVNSYDPTGLCDVVIGGITQNSKNATTVESYAESNSAISVYPYSSNSDTSSTLSTIGSALAGILEVAVQSLTTQGSTFAAVTGLLLAAQDGKPINVTTFSGGAAALTAAVSFLNSQGDAGKAVVNMISSITYVAPGAAVQLYNNGNTTFIGGGALNNLVAAATGISPPATVLNDTNNCGHDFQCLFEEFSDAFTSGDPCSKPVIVNQAPSSIGLPQYDPQMGRWIPFDFLTLVSSQPLPYVTSRLVPQ